MFVSAENHINKSTSKTFFPSLIEYLGSGPGFFLDSNDFSYVTDYILKHVISAEEVLFLRNTDSPNEFKIEEAKGVRSGNLKGININFNGNIASPTWRAFSVLNIINMENEQDLISQDHLLQELRHLDIKSSLVVAVGDLAVIVIGSRTQNAFSKYDESFLKSTAKQILYVMESSSKIAEAQKNLETTSKQLHLTEKIAFTKDVSQMLRSTLKAVHSVVKGDTGSIMLLSDSGKELKVMAAYGLPKEIGGYSVKIGQGIAGWVAKNKKAILVNDLPPRVTDYQRADLVSSISCPMIAGDKLIGVINIGSRKHDSKFSSEDIDRISELVEKASIAIDNSRSGRDLEDVFFETVKALAKLVEEKDATLKGHADRVAKHAVAIAKKMGLATIETRMIELAAVLHDIGYAGVNSSIFKVSSPLSSIERVLVNTHPVVASDALKNISRLSDVANIVLHHHERYDGKGYVSGLKGEDIPLGSRIIAVTDAFDAMISRRSFRDPLSVEEAIGELRKESGSQFDPNVVTVFSALVNS